jgi:hypothetical protein
MTLPERIDSRWIEAQTDEELRDAEHELNVLYQKQSAVEQARRGERYNLMQGSEILMSAWGRWSMIRSAMAARGLRLPALAR